MLNQYYFSEPAAMPKVIEIAVGTSEISDLGKLKAKMKRISPEEIVYAFLEAISDAIRNGSSEDVLKEWCTCSLTCSFHWRVVDSDDQKFYYAQRAREHLIIDHVTMRRTPVQWVFWVNGFKVMMENKHGTGTHPTRQAHPAKLRCGERDCA